MSATLRVLFTWRMGQRWREASEEAKAEAVKRWEALSGEWKKDPGIRYICNYDRTGGIGHHVLFEVDDITKWEEMSGAFYRADFPMDKGQFELVAGITATDEFWMS